MRPIARTPGAGAQASPEAMERAPAGQRMRVSVWILAAALLVWGHQHESLLIAVCLTAVLLVSQWVNWRWDLGDKDFNRLADVTGIAVVLLAIYQFDANAARGIYGVLEWMPVALFPLLAGQCFSTRARIGYSALFISVRRAAARGSLRESGSVDFRNPYFVICLVAAGGAGTDRELYLPAVVTLMLAALLSNRPTGHRLPVVLAVSALSAWCAFAGSDGVTSVRRALEPMLLDYFRDRLFAHRDPYRAYTAMGHIGRLKQSNRIMLRITPSPGQPVPRLMREAVYQTLAGNAWIGGGGDFEPLTPSADGTAWTLGTQSEAFRRITIARHMLRGRGLIPVPLGAFRLDELPVEDLMRNRLGTLKVVEGPDLVEYHVRYRVDGSGATAPKQADLTIPPDLEPLMSSVAADIAFEGKSQLQAARAIVGHFRKGFVYSLTLERPARALEPLEEFLLHRRSGHCEYFASATVLLLRAAGIPARYATGYAVSEWSELEQQFLVRRRHAHSWALAHIDGEWVDIDTTPPGWIQLEEASTPWGLNIYDAMSWLHYRYTRWRWLGTEDSPTSLLLWLGVPLAIYLAWRLATSKRVNRSAAQMPPDAALSVRRNGLDTEFMAALDELAERTAPPRIGESLRVWLTRLVRSGELPPDLAPADDLVELHYRCRFRPGSAPGGETRGALRGEVQGQTGGGVAAGEFEDFQRRAQAWRQRLEALPAGPTPDVVGQMAGGDD